MSQPDESSDITQFSMPRFTTQRYTVSGPGTLKLGVNPPAVLHHAEAVISRAIIDSFSTIESDVEDIIKFYFFRNICEEGEVFDSLILKSEMQFAAKRRLLKFIVRKLGMLDPKEADKYDTEIGRLMKVRNAITHGRFETDDNGLWLCYFSGEPKREKFDLTYLEKVKATLIYVFSNTKELYRVILLRQDALQKLPKEPQKNA